MVVFGYESSKIFLFGVVIRDVDLMYGWGVCICFFLREFMFFYRIIIIMTVRALIIEVFVFRW